MGWFSSSKEKKEISKFPWKNLESEVQLEEIINSDKTALIFKHSTRCPTSMMALKAFESQWTSNGVECDLYYLDLLNHRSVSAKIAQDLNVVHQSPQAILVRNGEVVYAESHHNIEARHIYKLSR